MIYSLDFLNHYRYNIVMNTKWLDTFTVIYKQRSLSGAAGELRLTKSAISQTLSLLEKDLKAQLFVRESRKLIPTPVADYLFGQVAPMLDSMSRAYNSIIEKAPEVIGTVAIGVPPDLASTYIIPCLAEFAKAHPDVQCRLKLGTPLVTAPLLMKNELDFAIIDASEVYEKLFPISTQTLTRETHVLVCSKSYLKGRQISAPSYETFCKEQFIAYTADAIEIRFWSKYHFGKVPRNLAVSLVVDQIQATKAAVLNGFGFAHIPERLVKSEIKEGNLCVWPTKLRKYENKISIAQLPQRKPMKLEKTVIKFIMEYFTKNGLLVI